MKNIPEKIYLQVDADGETPEEFKELSDISWCTDKIHDNDIEYVLADKHPVQEAQEVGKIIGSFTYDFDKQTETYTDLINPPNTPEVGYAWFEVPVSKNLKNGEYCVITTTSNEPCTVFLVDGRWFEHWEEINETADITEIVTHILERRPLPPAALSDAIGFAEWIDKNNCCIKSGGMWIYDSLTDLKTTEELYTLYLKQLK